MRQALDSAWEWSCLRRREITKNMELVSVYEKAYKSQKLVPNISLSRKHAKSQVVLTVPAYHTMINIRKSEASIHYMRDI